MGFARGRRGVFFKGRPILSNAKAHLISAGGHFMKAKGPFSRLPISSAPISFENKSSGRFFIKARPNDRFIKAEAAEWANIQI